MGKMKKGTNVGLDKNYDNICVGDTIIDENETEYVINAYGVAVDSTSGGTKRLSELKGVELVKAKAEKTPPGYRGEGNREDSRGGEGCRRPDAGRRAPRTRLDGGLQQASREGNLRNR